MEKAEEEGILDVDVVSSEENSSRSQRRLSHWFPQKKGVHKSDVDNELLGKERDSERFSPGEYRTGDVKSLLQKKEDIFSIGDTIR